MRVPFWGITVLLPDSTVLGGTYLRKPSLEALYVGTLWETQTSGFGMCVRLDWGRGYTWGNGMCSKRTGSLLLWCSQRCLPLKVLGR